MTITGNARVVLISNYCPTAKQSCPYNQLVSYINQSTVLIIIQNLNKTTMLIPVGHLPPYDSFTGMVSMELEMQ